MKKGYTKNIEQATLDNTNFRQVEYTGQHIQLVLMSLNPNEEIGSEIHPDNDQFFRFESGEGKVIVGETIYMVGDGDVVIIPAGTEHNIINTSSKESLKCYTIYAPPHHKDGVVHSTKQAAETDEEEFDGIISE
jgi:mannose-6-phosphate isomerase-like protein (cupin superfamily)